MKFFCPECNSRYEGQQLTDCPDDGARLFRLDAPDDDPLVGKSIDGRFRVHGRIAAGGMGTVYRGVQLSVQREVAIKVLRPGIVDREAALQRFFREAKVISELTHPNIVTLVDFGRDDDLDLLYLAMELVEGTQLDSLIRLGRLRTPLALEVAYQVCAALTEPHARGIVHRDLKPANLVLTPMPDGTLQVKVLDFGIARPLHEDTRLTKTGMICGTPAYMSPQQAREKPLDARSDLYAVGVVLFEMLSGHLPFGGDSDLQVLLDRIRRPAPRLHEITPEAAVPDPIGELVDDLLAQDPDDRPDCAHTVCERIDRLRDELQLAPVRLDPDDRTVFDKWLQDPFDLPDAKTTFGDASPIGAASNDKLAAPDTAEVEHPRGRTDEFGSARLDESTNPQPSASTKIAYAGAAAAELAVRHDRRTTGATQPSATSVESPLDTDEQTLSSSKTTGDFFTQTQVAALIGLVFAAAISILAYGGLASHGDAHTQPPDHRAPEAQLDERGDDPTVDAEDTAGEATRNGFARAESVAAAVERLASKLTTAVDHDCHRSSQSSDSPRSDASETPTEHDEPDDPQYRADAEDGGLGPL